MQDLSTPPAATALPFAALFFAVALSACESTDPAGPDEGNGGSGNGASGNVMLADVNNYLSESSLSIPTVQTAAATDLEICWSGVQTDIQCHALAPAVDLDNLALLRFLNLTPTEVEQKLTTGQLAMSEIAGYLDYHTTGDSTCTQLSSLSFLGTPVEVQEQYVESSDYVYMLLLAEGITPGVGARTMTFIEPTASSTNTRVDVSTGCGLLDFSADLSGLEPLPIAREAPWVVDWRNVTRDSLGNPIVYQSIDSVIVAHYAGLTVPELEAQILDLEVIATSLWEVSLTGGRSADLSLATNRETGEPFAGFSGADGVWALGVMCNTCQNPAPVILSILEPSDVAP